MVESGRVPGKGRVSTSIEKLSQRIQKMGRIYVSTDKMVESGQVPGTGRIPASIEKLSRRVLEKGRVYGSIEKLWNPGEYRDKVESLRV